MRAQRADETEQVLQGRSLSSLCGHREDVCRSYLSRSSSLQARGLSAAGSFGRLSGSSTARLHPCPSTPAAISCRFPGPTNVPDRVLRAIDQPTIDHRGPEFAAARQARCSRACKHVFQTRHPVVIYPASGTGAWEAALVNTLVARRPRADVRDRPVRDALAAHGRAGSGSRSTSCPATGAAAPTRRRSKRALAEDRAHAIKAVCVVHNETSTGAVTRVAEVRRAIDRTGHPALLMVDTISSLASIDYRMDEWGVDVTVGGSQKGLMLPPGSELQRRGRQGAAGRQSRRACRAPTGTGRRCWRRTRPASSPTRPRPICCTACARRCDMLQEEGLDNVFARHARHAEATRRAVRAWGLEILCAGSRASTATR